MRANPMKQATPAPILAKSILRSVLRHFINDVVKELIITEDPDTVKKI